MPCPCGSDKPLDQCCGPFVSGERPAPTAEALMRSRYTAYALKNIDYIARTHAPESHANFDRRAAESWAEQAKWLGLEILAAERGGMADEEGVVEFIATYRQQGETIAHHERSRFRRAETGEWLFVEGAAPRLDGEDGRRRDPSGRAASRPLARAPKVGRNDPCPCGSGRKYKKCCGA